MRREWVSKKLGEVCFFENGDRGKNYPSRAKFLSHGIPFVNAGHLVGDSVDLQEMNYISTENYKKLSRGKFVPNDILFCLRGSLGKFAKVQEGLFGAIASSLVIVRARKNILPQFLAYYFQSDTCAQMIAEYKGGAAQPNLGAKDLSKFEILVPEYGVQKHVVEILDEIFALIIRAKLNVETNLQNVKELFQSNLQKIFSTKEDEWVCEKLINLTTKIGSGATPSGGERAYKQQGVSLIRSLNVHDGEFRKKDLAFLDQAQASKLNNVKIEKEDVLFNITGASIARCCVVPAEILPARVNQHVSIIRLKKEIVLPEFVQLALVSRKNKDRLLEKGEQGATRQAITKAQLEEFEISFPKSLKKQQEIVDQVEALNVHLAKLQSFYLSKVNYLHELKSSILQKALTGELAVANKPIII